LVSTQSEKDIEAIEKVQKRATKQVKQIRKLSYCERLKQEGWLPPTKRASAAKNN